MNNNDHLVTNKSFSVWWTRVKVKTKAVEMDKMCRSAEDMNFCGHYYAWNGQIFKRSANWNGVGTWKTNDSLEDDSVTRHQIEVTNVDLSLHGYKSIWNEQTLENFGKGYEQRKPFPVGIKSKRCAVPSVVMSRAFACVDNSDLQEFTLTGIRSSRNRQYRLFRKQSSAQI